MANANPRHFLGWCILKSIAAADQKSLTKFENLEDGEIKHNLKDASMGQKQRKHSEINVVLQSINHIFPASSNFFALLYERFEQLNP